MAKLFEKFSAEMKPVEDFQVAKISLVENDPWDAIRFQLSNG